jgi:uncharacterized protein (TIGR00106 family)
MLCPFSIGKRCFPRLYSRSIPRYTLNSQGNEFFEGAGGYVMSMLVEFSVVPLGTGASVSPQIARVLKIVSESGVSYKANPMGTVLEGEWDKVMGVVKKCHDEVMKDAERVLTSITIDDRKGKEQRIEKKLESVEQKLGMKLKK